jgi:hypothetical protein
MKTLAAVVWLVVAVAYSAAQRAPADWHDDLVEHMAGTWILEGQVMGRPAHHDLVAVWYVLWNGPSGYSYTKRTVLPSRVPYPRVSA